MDGASESDARSHLQSLVGQTIPTLTGKPNRVIALDDDAVIVGTERSPEGEPVPLEWVQDAMDQLARDGEIEISVDSVGYRSAFIGAVLATLPGTRTELASRRVTLDEGAPRRQWREPPELLDAIDTITDLAGRGPARSQGRRQSAAERNVIEMLAVSKATEYFEAKGWTVENVGGVASYDLDCTKDDRELHVEAKGTTSLGHKVLLTRNEVARTPGHPDRQRPRACALLTGSRRSGETAQQRQVHFLDPKATEFFRDWDKIANDIVALLRAEAGRDPYDRQLSDLIGELSTRSVEFRVRWAAHDVRTHTTGVKLLHHPVVGDLDLPFESFQLAADPSQSLLTYTAEPGSPSQDALNLLASWAATTDDFEQAATY